MTLTPTPTLTPTLTLTLPLTPPLTLTLTPKALRREGQRLEARHGRDAGNGWAYNHSINKLRHYQEILLRDHFGEVPSGPSIREQEEAEEAEE